MDNTFTKFSTGGMEKGLDLLTPEFGTDVALDEGTVNVSGGIKSGLGPRYGFAPIPGHSDQEAVTGAALHGLQGAELGTGAGLVNRINIYGIIPLRLLDYQTVSVLGDYYAYLISRVSAAGGECFDIILGSIISGGVYQHSPSILSGLHTNATIYNSTGYEVVGELLRHKTSGDFATIMRDYLSITGQKNYASFADFSYSGADIPNVYLLGNALTVPDDTHAPNVNFNLVANFTSAAIANAVYGVPSQYQLDSYPTGNRVVVVLGLKATGAFTTHWNHTIDPNLFYAPARNYDTTTANIAFADSPGAADPIIGVYNTTVAALVTDKANTINSSYRAILVANLGRPICALIQEWHRNISGPLLQYVELTNNPLAPQNVQTLLYRDGPAAAATCFRQFPPYDGITPIPTGAPYAGTNIQLNAANTGIFESTTSYEITFSHYYKRLNYETNVGQPVKFLTGATNFVSLQINDIGPMLQSLTGTGHCIMNFETFRAPNFIHLNFVEYRFYYRLLGTFEWLPLERYDAAQLWGDVFPTNGVILGGVPVAGSLGGQPGGFNDFSNLPTDQYTSTVVFKNRAFWSSDKAIYFSNKNNILAYAGRNSIAATSGKFRGMIVHNYPGQAEQNSRLIIFGTKETYVGRFSGDPLLQSIQVSPDATGSFPVDGSDFVIDPWTSVTAFSHRAAVVADGILYFWGPRGIHRDDGVQTPTRISDMLNPDIFNLYDPARTDEIHAIFNLTTHEITWFYPPKPDDGSPTHGSGAPNETDGFVTQGIVYNTRSETFTYTGYAGKIDSAFGLEVTTDIKTSGQRNVLTVRDGDGAGPVTQRAYYYDHFNRSGDMRPNHDFMVKSFTTPTTGQRRLSLAAGFSLAELNNMAVGDFICLNQLRRYCATLTEGQDLIATIAAKNLAGTIDIILPDGVDFDASATLTRANYFPIWHAGASSLGTNGFPFSLVTTYWAPGGINFWGYWAYFYAFFRVHLLPTVVPQRFDFSYRTPISADWLTDSIALVDNSDGIMQLYHPMAPGNQNFEGQALKFILSGTQLGSEWVVQYVEGHAIKIEGEQLKDFEG